MDQGQHILNGTVNLQGAEPVADLTLTTQNVRIEPLMVLVGKPDIVTGNLDNTMQIKGSLSHPYIHGEVHAADGSAAKQLFNNISGHYAYEDGLLRLQDFVVNAFTAA